MDLDIEIGTGENYIVNNDKEEFQDKGWQKVVSNKRKANDMGSEEDMSGDKDKMKKTKDSTKNNKNVTENALTENIVTNYNSDHIKKKYSESNRGPYGVIVRSARSSLNGFKKMNIYTISKITCNKYKKVQQIFPKSGRKIEVIFNNVVEANKVLEDKEIEERGLEAFIPTFRLQRQGVIRGVDVEITAEEIYNYIESKQEVVHVRRLMKRNRNISKEDDAPKWIPSQSVIISFEGQELPTETFIFKIHRLVEPYVTAPIFCFSCQKPGHTGKNCNNSPVCRRCGEAQHEGLCNSIVARCVNCNEEHFSSDRKYIVYKQENEIRRIMAYENKSMEDARKIVLGETRKKRPFATKEAFPELGKKMWNQSQKLSQQPTIIQQQSTLTQAQNQISQQKQIEKKTLIAKQGRENVIKPTNIPRNYNNN